MAASTLATTPLELSVPAIAQWTSQTRKAEFLGLNNGRHPCSVVADLHLDETRCTFSCKLCVPVKIKSRANKLYMYLFIEPDRVSSLKLRDDDIPQDVVNTFVIGQHCSLRENMLGMSFSLATHASIAGPKTTIQPRSAAVEKILDTLIQLGGADHITIWFPCSATDRKRLSPLPAKISEGLLFGATNIDTLYAGNGGRLLYCREDLLISSGEADSAKPKEHDVSHVHNEWDLPPTYDQARTSPPQASLSKRWRQGSTSDTEKPLTKRRDLQHTKTHALTSSNPEPPLKQACDDDAVWKRAITEQVAFMAAQIASMRQEIQTSTSVIKTVKTAQTKEPYRPLEAETACSSPPPSMCSTIEDSLEDRLVLAERDIASLRRDLAYIRESLIIHLPQSINDMAQKFDDGLVQQFQASECLGDRLDELRTEVSTEVHELFDDIPSGAKLELRDFVQDEMKDVEENIKDAVRTALSQATLQIDLEG